jgi:hypothetical protein
LLIECPLARSLAGFPNTLATSSLVHPFSCASAVFTASRQALLAEYFPLHRTCLLPALSSLFPACFTARLPWVSNAFSLALHFSLAFSPRRPAYRLPPPFCSASRSSSLSFCTPQRSRCHLLDGEVDDKRGLVVQVRHVLVAISVMDCKGLGLHHQFDLKGSTYGRSTGPEHKVGCFLRAGSNVSGGLVLGGSGAVGCVG